MTTILTVVVDGTVYSIDDVVIIEVPGESGDTIMRAGKISKIVVPHPLDDTRARVVLPTGEAHWLPIHKVIKG